MRSAAPDFSASQEVGSVTTEAPAAPSIVSTARLSTSTAAPIPTQVLSTPTAIAKVSITAINGNLYIRRGPDLAFNPIAVLMKNQSVDALARDILSDWVQIQIPGHAGQIGWVSIQTKYSAIEGDVKSLPVIKPDTWAAASYLRNCTHHQMIAQPGDIMLPSLLEYPENEVRVFPGSYLIYDLDHPDVPEVATAELREGVEIDIRVDGNGESRKCP